MATSSTWIPLQAVDLPAALRRTAGPPPPGIRLCATGLPADLGRIVTVYDAAFGLEGEDALTAAQLAGLSRHPGLDLTGAFLAIDGERAVGVGMGSVEVPAPGGEPHRGAVELLAVLPGYRRRGIARALLHNVLVWLVKQGVTVVEATVEDVIALAMLEGYGFACAGEVAEDSDMGRGDLAPT